MAEQTVPKQELPELQKLPEQKLPEQPYLLEADPKKSHEERINAFLSKKSGSTLRINDFLKSLFPLPVMGAQPLWKDQGNNKRLRILLDKLQSERKLEITANSHKKLATPYYDDSQNPITKYYDISTVILEAVIF